MTWRPEDLPDEALRFLAERHLATLSIPRSGRAPHVTPVGFTWDSDSGLARIITFAGAEKVRLISTFKESPIPVAICQVDGGRWLTLEGCGVVSADPLRCAEGERRYAQRYRPPSNRGTERRIIEVAVSRILGRA